MIVPRHKVLLDAARHVIRSTKGILGDEARHSRMVLVGGLAVMRWTSEYRITNDLDFFVGGNLRASNLKRELPRFCRDFKTSLEAVNGVTYRSSIAKSIVPIDFIDTTVAQPLSEYGVDGLPWATRDDLISMKVFGASKREAEEKRCRDIADIQKMLVTTPGPLVFAGSAVARENKNFVQGFVPLLVQNSNWSEKEWLDKLGL